MSEVLSVIPPVESKTSSWSPKPASIRLRPLERRGAALVMPFWGRRRCYIERDIDMTMLPPPEVREELSVSAFALIAAYLRGDLLRPAGGDRFVLPRVVSAGVSSNLHVGTEGSGPSR